MSKRRDFSAPGKQVRPNGSYFPSTAVLLAVSGIALGAGVMLASPGDRDSQPQAASATTGVSETTGSTTTAADESLCEKQAWPYIDQRCAQSVEAARGTRQVRIVTDKGNSVTVRTSEPIVEAKPKPAPQAPVVAKVEKPMGPPVAPVAGSPPQVEKVAAAPQQQVAPAPQNPPPQSSPPAPAIVQAAVAPQRSTPAPQNLPPQTALVDPPAQSDPGARGASDPSANIRSAPTAPAAASTAPMTAGLDAFVDGGFKKSKSARAAEKAARREARRQKAIEEFNADVSEEVAARVRAMPADAQNSRRTRIAGADRGRGAVPEDVLQAVEQATASELRGRRGRQMVTIGSPRGGNRVYLVPGNEVGGW